MRRINGRRAGLLTGLAVAGWRMRLPTVSAAPLAPLLVEPRPNDRPVSSGGFAAHLDFVAVRAPFEHLQGTKAEALDQFSTIHIIRQGRILALGRIDDALHALFP